PTRIVQGPPLPPDQPPKGDSPTPRTDGATVAKDNPARKPGPKYGPPYDPDYAPPHELLTDRLTELLEFQKATGGPPLLLKLHDLDQDATRQRLLAELKKGGSFRLEL